MKLKPSSIKNRLKHVVAYLEQEGRYYRRIPLEDQLAKMREDWDDRARENAYHFVATGREHWTDEEFYASGEQTVEDHVLSDMERICQGRAPNTMKVLEIGCGAGRVTRALARLFGEVHGVDISAEMVRLAKLALKPFPNAFVYQNNGTDLSVIPGGNFDFGFSHLVFQHIPSRRIIERYLQEVHRLLCAGALFKFQVQGIRGRSRPDDTWLGVAFSEDQIVRMAGRCGFEARYRDGAGQQEFWIWCFKKG
jgi:SAM-dependent methyltransferase